MIKVGLEIRRERRQDGRRKGRTTDAQVAQVEEDGADSGKEVHIGGAREWRGPRSPGEGLCVPLLPTARPPALKHHSLPSTCFLCCSLPRIETPESH